MRRSKRELESALDDLGASRRETLGLAEMWDWIDALNHHGTDVGRPPEYFGDSAEWNPESAQEGPIERYDELRHVTPPEAYVLCYMDEDLTRDALALLLESDHPDAEAFRRDANLEGDQ